MAMELTSSRNVDEVVGFLKKELLKTNEQEYEKVYLLDLLSEQDINVKSRQNNEYKQMLVHAIHSCAIKFSEVASNVVHVLMEFLGDTNSASAVDVVAFVR
jgi:coatomer subunit beta